MFGWTRQGRGGSISPRNGDLENTSTGLGDAGSLGGAQAGKIDVDPNRGPHASYTSDEFWDESRESLEETGQGGNAKYVGVKAPAYCQSACWMRFGNAVFNQVWPLGFLKSLCLHLQRFEDRAAEFRG
mmetsp:Transcript_67805/g.141743  ORF Transcript_67805/g.141743 Transcript_67805/m.141743 type:complete len:128 (-) Transcript_67805:548-931(-)